MLSLLLKRLVCLLCFLFLASGCGIFKKPEPTIAPFISSTVVAVPIESDTLKYVECPFEGTDEIPPEQMADIRCAKLTVPEDWQQPNGTKIQLAVAIVKTESSDPKPDPVLVFLGKSGLWDFYRLRITVYF